MILIIGGKGSIGSRYAAILRFIKQPYVIHDMPFEKELGDYEFDRAIIASPTDTHYSYCKHMIDMGKPFLCEKPLSKRIDECRDIADAVKSIGIDGRVVCNYRFTQLGLQPKRKIIYDYYKTGNDGLMWDCCQLIHMDSKAEIKNESPVFSLYYSNNSHVFKLTLDDVEMSYIRMLQCWLHNPKELWSVEDGVKMTEGVLKRV